MNSTEKRTTAALLDPNDNPYYLLATLYGEGEENSESEVANWNRRAWNRWMCKNLESAALDRLKVERDWDDIPLGTIEAVFRERSNGRPLPDSRSFSMRHTGCSRFLNLSGFIMFGASFEGSAFEKGASLSNARILDMISLDHAVFNGPASFDGAVFFDVVSAVLTRFKVAATFAGCKFHRNALFVECMFQHTDDEYSVSFTRSVFKHQAHFSDCQFSKGVDFYQAKFHDFASFMGARFQSSSNFSNSLFRSTVVMTNASFVDIPPAFYEGRIHESISWPLRDAWPLPRLYGYAAEEYVLRYACLKRLMESQKRQNDELDFFCLELQSRRFVEPYRLRNVMIAVYGFISDFGRSVLRPVVAFAILTIVGIWVIAADPAFNSDWSPGRVWGMSVANMLGPFGLRKDLLGAASYEILAPFTLAFAGAQSILGLGLLFLAGLALRNFFRMR